MYPSSLLWKIIPWVIFFFFGNVYNQDLAELAAQEKARRRQSGGEKARIHIEYFSSESQKNRREGIREQNVSSLGAGQKKDDSAEGDSIRKGNTNRRAYLALRGPRLKQMIQTEQGNAERLEQEVSEARRRYPPILRHGALVEDSRLQTLGNELEKCRQRLIALRKEQRDLEEEVRRRGWPPGLLRGQLP